jgi:hypothetical protein
MSSAEPERNTFDSGRVILHLSLVIGHLSLVICHLDHAEFDELTLLRQFNARNQ